ncbi:uncharacterized protein LOC119547973 [Drosophila subpulchrella]|uniref:uncharacterized protein LOC119547973 n=1 Tax=Drosophila subpulchrella TaxID=1486046 RepID=UPI0018A15F51|nr:uncharacterized protein LOC119547973 [Drosophila subpulchrella]
MSQLEKVEIAGSSNWGQVEGVKREPNEKVAVVAARPTSGSGGLAARWLAMRGATPQPTFPTTTGITDAFYSEGSSSASFTSVSPRSSDSTVPPVGRPQFSTVLKGCNSQLAQHGNDLSTLEAAEDFHATLTTVYDAVGRLTAETAVNLRDNPNESQLYRKLVSHLVEIESNKNLVQSKINEFKEESEEVPASEPNAERNEFH